MSDEHKATREELNTRYVELTKKSGSSESGNVSVSWKRQRWALGGSLFIGRGKSRMLERGEACVFREDQSRAAGRR